MFVILILSFSTTLGLPVWGKFIKLPPTPPPGREGDGGHVGKLRPLLTSWLSLQTNLGKAGWSLCSLRYTPTLPYPTSSKKEVQNRPRAGEQAKPQFDPHLLHYIPSKFWSSWFSSPPCIWVSFFWYMETIPSSGVAVRTEHSDKIPSTVLGFWWIGHLYAFKTKRTTLAGQTWKWERRLKSTYFTESFKPMEEKEICTSTN